MTWGTPLFCESGGGKWIIYRRREARRQNKLLTKRIEAYVGKSWWEKKALESFALSQDELGLAVTLAYFGFSAGRNQLGAGEIGVSGERETAA